MKIMEMLESGFIIEELKAANKRDVLAEMIAVIAKGERTFKPEAMLQVFLEREQLGSTGIGDGIAIPHGKLAGLDKTVIAVGRSRKGVAFGALDGKPVHLFFLLAAPENCAGHHLKALAKISRMLKDGVFRENLLKAKGHDDFVRIIAKKDEEC
jgi:nitrogen PTS system EIIA component